MFLDLRGFNIPYKIVSGGDYRRMKFVILKFNPDVNLIFLRFFYPWNEILRSDRIRENGTHKTTKH